MWHDVRYMLSCIHSTGQVDLHRGWSQSDRGCAVAAGGGRYRYVGGRVARLDRGSPSSHPLPQPRRPPNTSPVHLPRPARHHRPVRGISRHRRDRTTWSEDGALPIQLLEQRVRDVVNRWRSHTALCCVSSRRRRCIRQRHTHRPMYDTAVTVL